MLRTGEADELPAWPLGELAALSCCPASLSVDTGSAPTQTLSPRTHIPIPNLAGPLVPIQTLPSQVPLLRLQLVNSKQDERSEKPVKCQTLTK